MTQTRHEAAVAEAIQEQQQTIDALGQKYNYGWHDSDEAGRNARRGLDEDVVRYISSVKNEPEWMLKNRLKALRLFERRPMPAWGPDLSFIDFDEYKYFVRSTDKPAASWDELPEDIKNTYDRLGIPEAEKARLVAGVAAQYESEVVYNQIRDDLESQGVVFLDTDSALKQCPDLFREHVAMNTLRVEAPQTLTDFRKNTVLVMCIIRMQLRRNANGHSVDIFLRQPITPQHLFRSTVCTRRVIFTNSSCKRSIQNSKHFRVCRLPTKRILYTISHAKLDSTEHQFFHLFRHRLTSSHTPSLFYRILAHPFSNCTLKSHFSNVLSRCAIERIVICPLNFKIVFVILASVSVSSADVASSKIRTSGR